MLQLGLIDNTVFLLNAVEKGVDFACSKEQKCVCIVMMLMIRLKNTLSGK